MGRAIRHGIAAARANLGAVTWLWLASLLASLPFALVGAFVVDRHFSSSITAEAFAAGLEPELVAELIFERGDELALLVPMFVGALSFWVALTAFMRAAILATVASETPMRTGELLAAGGRGFGRLLRLLPLGVAFTALIVGLSGAGLSKLHGYVTEDWVSEVGVLTTKLVVYGLVLLILAWANGAYDLMKVEAVAKGEHRARWAFWRGLVAAARGPKRLLAVYLPFMVSAVVATLLVSLVDVRIARTGYAIVVVGFVLQQIVAYLRAWLAVALAGAEVTLLSRP